MQLTFAYTPVRDLPQALAFYRDTLGWEESWREGDTTVALQLSGTDVEVMLDQVDDDSRPGPVFLVESVKDFQETFRDRLPSTGTIAPLMKLASSDSKYATAAATSAG